MKRSELKSKYFKNQTAHHFELYKKQKNYKYEKERNRYYNNMNLANLMIVDILSDKGSYTPKANLVNKDKVISDDSTLAEIISKYYKRL